MFWRLLPHDFPNWKTVYEYFRNRKLERTFGWFENYHRLSKDYEYHSDTSETMVHIAMIHIMVRRLA